MVGRRSAARGNNADRIPDSTPGSGIGQTDQIVRERAFHATDLRHIGRMTSVVERWLSGLTDHGA
jgi:hypothetical protein